jgi:competence protein ComGC
MSHALHPALQVLMALSFLAVLILPNIFANEGDLDSEDRNRSHIP